MRNKTSDEKMAIELFYATSNREKNIILLKSDYGYQLTKQELSEVLRISIQTIDRRIKEGINIPEYTRSGKGAKASYYFPVASVAEYLSRTVKVY